MLKSDLIMGIAGFKEQKLSIKESAFKLIGFIELLEKFDSELNSYEISGIKKSIKINFGGPNILEKTSLLTSFILDNIKGKIRTEYKITPDENYTNPLGINISFSSPMENRKLNVGFNLFGGFDNFSNSGGYCTFRFFDRVANTFAYYSEIMKISIDYFSPEYCELINKSIYTEPRELYDSGIYRIGWISYFSNNIELPVLPYDILIEPFNNGNFIILTEEFFDPDNCAHFDKFDRVARIFKEKYPKPVKKGL